MLRETKKENFSLSSAKKDLDESKKTNQTKVAELQKQINTAYEETKDLRLKQKELKKQLESKNQENDELLLTLESLNSRSDKDISQYREELERLTVQIRSMQDSLLKERTQTTKLRTEIDSLTLTNKRQSDKIANLTTENTVIKTKMEDLEKFVEQRLADTNTSLRHLSYCNNTTAKKQPSSHSRDAFSSVQNILDEYKAKI